MQGTDPLFIDSVYALHNSMNNSPVINFPFRLLGLTLLNILYLKLVI